jgi:hypothetical protein
MPTTKAGSSAAAAAAAPDIAPPTAAACKPAAKSERVAEKVGFPALGTHDTLAELAEWFYVNPLADTGMTPQQLEAAGKADGQQWRGGKQGKRYKRWCEYEHLLRQIEKCRSQLEKDQRSSSINPHRLVDVDPVTAARELDRQRVKLGLTVCEYRQFIQREVQSKGYAKGKAAEQGLQQEDQAEAAQAVAVAVGVAAGAGGAAATATAAGGAAAEERPSDAGMQQPQQQSGMQQLAGLVQQQRRRQQHKRGRQKKKAR